MKEQQTIEKFTVEHFTAWLKTLPADTQFHYGATDNCAVAQYLKAQGHPGAHCGSHVFGLVHRVRSTHRIPAPVARAVAVVPYTFSVAQLLTELSKNEITV